jgi:hypothetical protein
MSDGVASRSAGISSATSEMRSSVVATRGTPVLFDTVRASEPDGIRFDVWYCNEHLRTLATLRAFTGLRRYAAPSRGSYLVIGELAEAAGSGVPEGRPTSLPASIADVERFVGGPLGTQRRADVDDSVLDAPVVYPVFFEVPEVREVEFNRWYDEEHLPLLLACPQWVMCRRFRIRSSSELRWTHVALHYLTDLRALQSPERDLARSTPWRRELAAEGWFKPEYRVFYRLQELPQRWFGAPVPS